jgi:hypothetical protein
MPQVQIKQNLFSSGISDDQRISNGSNFLVAKMFDIFTSPHKLIPYRSFEADTETSISATDLKQYFVTDFLYASASTKLYGLGQTGAGLTKIVQKAVAESGLWTTPASSEGNGAVRNGCFVEYKDYLWGFQGTTQVWKWGLLSGTPSITNSAGIVGTVYNTVTAVAVNAGGTGYNINDVLTITQGSNNATVIVTAITGAGVVSTVTILQAGFNRTAATGLATTVSPSGGTGCTINISTVGNVSTPITSVAQGLVAKDDNLYLPYNNILARVYPSGTVQDQALKLPTNLKITSLCNYGNYLAIGCSPVSIYNGVSKVFLWNLTSPDIQEVIDWGEGELRVLETIEGMIIGITDRFLNNSSGAGRGSLIIQGYAGGSPQVLKELFTSKLNNISMPLTKPVKNNRVFFSAKIMTNDAGTEYNEGIWSFGRKNGNYPYAISLDYVSSAISTGGIQGFGSAGNFFFIAHSTDGSIAKTDDTAVYTETSILETQILDFGDTNIVKRLDFFKVSFEKIVAGSLTVKVKADDATSWTTIGTFNTVGEVAKTFANIESTGLAFPSAKEYKFRLESIEGLIITGWNAVATPISTI